jgi:hypothetical protein
MVYKSLGIWVLKGNKVYKPIRLKKYYAEDNADFI